ncbi:ATP-binding protein [Methylobacterium sp. NEAU 140]|uniref:ATP-binding protein n=1 Tax=Methylobacterium sp. NEAU 140 TaxID=3064945 RepID=UPI0027373CAF|nr:ATP-binding protein [Methylobacterium sp. NEAU 140]MDP4025130.1 ATP-binding protein [Methylobacterium sp. NEAU 140]
MASEAAEIRRLVRATQRGLIPAQFPPRRDIDFACLGPSAGPDATLFHDAFWARRDRFACFVVRIGGGTRGRLGAHALRALLRAALRVYPADRALDLSLRAFRETGSEAPVDAAVTCLSPGTGAAMLAAHGAGLALHLEAEGAERGAGPRAQLAVGDLCWLSIGDCPRPVGDGDRDAADRVRAALAGRAGAVAAAVALRDLRPARGRVFVLSNDVAEIGPLLAEVEEYLLAEGVRPEALAGLDVALDEVLTNIVLYAYGDGQAHEIVVRVEADRTGLTVEVRDDGLPFDPTAAAAPAALDADLDDRPIGGLGLHFVRTLFDTVAYSRARGWNVLTLSRASAPEPESRPESRMIARETR